MDAENTHRRESEGDEHDPQVQSGCMFTVVSVAVVFGMLWLAVTLLRILAS